MKIKLSMTEVYTKYWYKNYKFHRKDGPAIEYANGHKEWWINDKCHREDGPAVEFSYDYKLYYLENKNYNEEDYLKELKNRKIRSIFE